MARFLEKLNLEVVILHEQANKGRTVIEKFEQHSDVGFAVVLMTPDDIGCLVQTSQTKKQEHVKIRKAEERSGVVLSETGSDNLHVIAGEVSRVAEHIS